MKANLKLATLALLTICHLQPATLQAQGSLTPPGAPSASMKTLDQIFARTEARLPITNSASLVTISQPGSYYLTTNLTVGSGNAITIATNGVSLDLNGFTVKSASTGVAATYGIYINSGLNNLIIRDGFVEGGVTNDGSGTYSGPGFAYGIYSPAARNTVVARVAVTGCRINGISLPLSDSTVVECCTVRTVGSVGIYASRIGQSAAIDCGSDAIFGDQVSDCRGESNSGMGVHSDSAQNCYGSSSSYYGLYATTAQNCYGFTAGSYYGLYATATAQNCYGYNAGSGYGLYANTAQNCYGYNAGSGYGLYATRIAIGCSGLSSSGTGLYAQNAAFCTGYRPGGTAIQATVGTGCYAASGTNDITYKYNMP